MNDFEEKPPDYKRFKAERFGKNKQRIYAVLNGIDQSSLKKDDKIMLQKQIAKIVDNFIMT